jgi:hydrogenase maturation factor
MTVVDATVAPVDDGPADDLAASALSLARRFAARATMWCVAREWPSHGRHVAVEFVHPVVVGTKALPAVHIDGADPTSTLRLLARPGDVLLAVSSARDRPTADLLRRAEAWGLTRVWLGAGPRPSSGLAEHTVWLEGPDAARSARSGDLVLLYHLLWELTQVVFEHPGLLIPDSDCTGEACITCSDEGQVAEVRAVHGDGSAAVVMNGGTETVDVTLVEPVAADDLLLVHAGVALTTLGR